MKVPHDQSRNPHDSPVPAEASDAALYRRVYPRLTAIAAAILGRQEGAEDIVQQAARTSLEKQQAFATDRDWVTWLAEVVRRCALNERRKQQRRRTFATDPSDLNLVAMRSTGDESTAVDAATGRLKPDQADFDDRLLQALEQLSDEARCCLLLRTVHELDYHEIAELLGIPRGTAMSHVFRSRQTLRQRLTTQAALPVDSSTLNTRNV